ncbi:substrate-binding domain-containing protein [Peribacillus simplex]|uniref:substrate-binding domain-containing protein n=1 Tax=Peribacillus simplex TaxID=1478 RepID=UPI003D2678E7
MGGGVNETFEDLYAEHRFKGFKHAMEEARLAIQSEWVMNTQWKMENGYEKMKSLIKRDPLHLPTAMVCASDLMATPAMRK